MQKQEESSLRFDISLSRSQKSTEQYFSRQRATDNIVSLQITTKSYLQVLPLEYVLTFSSYGKIDQKSSNSFHKNTPNATTKQNGRLVCAAHDTILRALNRGMENESAMTSGRPAA